MKPSNKKLLSITLLLILASLIALAGIYLRKNIADFKLLTEMW